MDFTDYLADSLEQLGEFENLGLLCIEGSDLVITDAGRLVARALVQPFDRFAVTGQGERFSRII